MTNGAPVYVKIDAYKEVLEVMGLVKHRLNDARDTLNKIRELKTQEDRALEAWGSALDEVERKIETMDKELFEPEGM